MPVNINELDHQIDKYLRNELQNEELKEFEKLMERHEELKKEVEIRYDIMMGIRAAEQKELLEYLNQIRLQKPTKTNKSISKVQNQIPLFWVVLAIILILSLFLVYRFIF